jgi:hypothetical protein
MPKYEVPMKIKLERLVAKDEVTGCWNWTGQINNYGYAMVSFNTPNKRRTTTTAHRASYQTFVGPVQWDQVVCHRCDNPLCINPDHLFIGTQLENMEDMVAKGRDNYGHSNMAGLGYTKEFRILVANDNDRTMVEARDFYGVSLPSLTKWRKRYRITDA